MNCWSRRLIRTFPMPSDTEYLLPGDASTGKRTRGRPPAQSAAETHQQRIARLQSELRQAQEALKTSEDRRASIVGHACLRHIRHNTEFARQLAAALRAEIKAKAEQNVVRDLLADNSDHPAPAMN
jgi:hypothetical protein